MMFKYVYKESAIAVTVNESLKWEVEPKYDVDGRETLERGSAMAINALHSRILMDNQCYLPVQNMLCLDLNLLICRIIHPVV